MTGHKFQRIANLRVKLDKERLCCWINLALPIIYIHNRAVARSKNLGGHIVLDGDNVPLLVEIGLTDLSKSGGVLAPGPPLETGLESRTQNRM